MKPLLFCKGKYCYFIFFLSLVILQSCNVYRIPLSVKQYKMPHNIQSDSCLVEFKQYIAGKPLYLTVWTNTNGPIIDSNEYKRIGYTQHRSFMVIPIPGYSVTNMSVESVIYIPFGNLLSQKLISTIDSSHSKLLVAWNATDSKTLITRKNINKKYIVSVDSFYVWEAPLNHLNYYSVLTVKTVDLTKNIESSRTIHKEMKEYKMGSILSTSGTFLKNMNKSANEFAEEIVFDIISNISKE